MKLFLSGHSGFVGQNILKAFYDCEIYVISRKEQENQGNFKSAVNWRNISLEHLNGSDMVIHLAGKAHDLKKASNPDEYFHVNTGLTKRLFDIFLQSSAKDFIYFSSVKAAADQVQGILDETAEPKPRTPYGQSKLKAEEYLLSKKLPEGKRLFILRPCMIHGPGNKGNLNLLYKVVKKGIPYPLAAFENKRSFLSIENLNYIIRRILEDSNIPGGIYNVADDESLSTTDVIKIIGKASNISPRLWPFSASLITKLAFLGDVITLPLNSERLKKLTENYVVDNGKIKRALNILTLPVSAREGLMTTIRSFNN